MRFFDRFLQKSNASQVLLLIAFIVAMVFVFIVLGNLINADFTSITNNQLDKIEAIISTDNSEIDVPLTIGEKIIYVFGRLIDPGYIGDSESPLFSSVISLLGWIFCSGFLIAIITNGYFERIRKINNGLVRYSLKNHCIIIGAKDPALSIIRMIREGHMIDGYNLKKDIKIVFFSSQDSNLLRDKMHAFLTKKERKNIILYKGKRNSDEHLSSLCIENSSCIFVIGDSNTLGNDSMNIICVKKIATIINKKLADGKVTLDKEIPCNLLLDDLSAFYLLDDKRFFPYPKILALKKFNNHDSWSSLIFSSNTEYSLPLQNRLKSLLDKSKVIRFVIIGFNRMGIALVDQAARTLHFDNNIEVIITIIDPNNLALEKRYRSTREALDEIPNMKFEFYSYTGESTETKKLIFDWQEKGELLGIAICFKNNIDSIFHASVILNNISGNSLEVSVPVYVRQTDSFEINQVEISQLDQKNKDTQIKYFGMYNKTVGKREDLNKNAANSHNNYLLVSEIIKEDRELKQLPNYVSWENLSEDIKNSNLHKAESYNMKKIFIEKYAKELKIFSGSESAEDIYEYIKALFFIDICFAENDNLDHFLKGKIENKDDRNCNVDLELKEKLINYKEKLSSLDKNDKDELRKFMELLAEVEHNRWIGEKVIAGWVFDKERDDYRKRHPNIVSYTDLDEKTKMYDRGGFL